MNNPTPATLRAAAYGRVSTDRQDLSEGAQRAALAAFAASQGFTLDEQDVFFDPEVTGKSVWRDRPAGRQCLEALSHGRCQVLIVHKVDRLGRDAIDLQTTIRDIVALGDTHNVYFAVMGKTFNAREPLGQFIIAMLAWVAELEWHSIRDRICTALDAKWKAREAPAHAPYGWDKVPGQRVNHRGLTVAVLDDNLLEQAWLAQMLAWRGDRLPAELRPGAADRVQEFAHMIHDTTVQTPGWGEERIATALNALSVPTKHGVRTYRRRGEDGEMVVVGSTSGRWSERAVRGILTNRWTREWCKSQGAAPASR